MRLPALLVGARPAPPRQTTPVDAHGVARALAAHARDLWALGGGRHDAQLSVLLISPHVPARLLVDDAIPAQSVSPHALLDALDALGATLALTRDATDRLTLSKPIVESASLASLSRHAILACAANGDQRLLETAGPQAAADILARLHTDLAEL